MHGVRKNGTFLLPEFFFLSLSLVQLGCTLYERTSSGPATSSVNAPAGSVSDANDVLTGDVVGKEGSTVVSNVGGVSAANITTAVNSINNAASVNTASAVVARDGAGNFSAGTITASLIGNASSASLANYALGQTDATVASASNVRICATGSLTMISGSATINTFSSLPAGSECALLFTGSATINHNATTSPKLILSGSGPYTSAPNNFFKFVSLGGGDWLEMSRTITKDSYLSANNTNVTTLVPNTTTPLIPSVVNADYQNEYVANGPQIGSFILHQSGIYAISLTAQYLPNADASAGGCLHLQGLLNGAVLQDGYFCPAASQYSNINISQTLYLNAGQALAVNTSAANFVNPQKIYAFIWTVARLNH